jgi:hypothetical protein
MINFMKITTPVALLLALAQPFFAQASSISNQGTWETSLQGRDLDGNSTNGYEAFYDVALDVTWLSDANFAKTTNYDADGYMNWSEANGWANSLAAYGVTGWRLPTMTDYQGDGCTAFKYAGGTNVDCGYNIDTTLSELAHLWYITLGNKSFFAPSTAIRSDSGAGLTNTGPFLNLTGAGYWTNVSYAPYPDQRAWEFGTYGGFQDYYPQANGSLSWAVHDGDIAAIPEPDAYVLAIVGVFAIWNYMVTRRRPHGCPGIMESQIQHSW